MIVVEPADVPWTWLTPRLGREAPIHRWFTFPHSFAPDLVGWLIEELAVAEGDRVLDPFCGAGTTLVEAQRRGLRSVGSDLLPLSILASAVKTTRWDPDALRMAASDVAVTARAGASLVPPTELLRRAFTDLTYGRLRKLLGRDHAATDAVSLAVLASAPQFSRLRADGGWLRVVTPGRDASAVGRVVARALVVMADDAEGVRPGPESLVRVSDARRLALDNGSIGAIITSPPYPNRHDYTRVFAVELELGFQLGESVRQLRYQAMHSHPEARPARPSSRYREPGVIRDAVETVAANHGDPRIPEMLSGYFRDMHDILAELKRVLRPGGRAALVVGNARYCGVAIRVDEWTVVAAEQAGFRVDAIKSLRFRGNSAQQMKVYGRAESRESAVLLSRI